MQGTHKEQEQVPLAPADPGSQTVTPVQVPQVEESDDDPDVIFSKAVAEIDTQPLERKKSRRRWQDMFQTVLCISMMVGSIIGMVYQVITYPHTLVILYAREKPASITVTLAIPTRMLAPVTVTRTATAPTTGHGHQDARAASGMLTFYNGNASPQTIPGGTMFTGNDGVKVTTDQSVTVPAANLPVIGESAVSAHALVAGSRGSIATFDVNVALSGDLKVKNATPFTNGRDAREYQAVAQRDLDSLTAQTLTTVNQQIPQAFLLRSGEALHTTTCATKTTADHALYDEAQTVTVKTARTCAAVAYSQEELTKQATAAFAHTRPASQYQLIGSVQTTLVSVSPLSVTTHGTWAYTFSPQDEQDLAQHIQGDTPAQALAYLLHTGMIAQANVPGILPASMYIQFVVLLG